ncbi:peptidase S8/S53 domain-containing protein [Scenedesmus sp. NREL 46B-D3]|nr:peptidase S8/S53 domain-containing protein [Scenedesmus sp. NREL 46B-D3]
MQVPQHLGSASSAVLDGFLADDDVLQLVPVTLLEHAATQAGPSWGLDRIDERHLPLDGRYTFSGDSSSAGAGVWVYILDSGVRWNHTNFQGRGRAGTFWPYVGVSNELDNNGHGTHVAGIAASQLYGVAKGSNIVSVKVLDDQGLGTSDAVVAGLNWVVADRRVANHRKVINLSLSGTPSEALEAAIYQAYLAGLTLVAAAGNSNDDACFYRPHGPRGC